MDKFNALLNTFEETEQAKENARLEKEAKEKEKQALETAFEDERQCGLVDLTEEFFHGFADFLGIREKIGTDLILEHIGDLSEEEYDDIVPLTRISFSLWGSSSTAKEEKIEPAIFHQFNIKLTIKDKTFTYPFYLRRSEEGNDISYIIYLDGLTREKYEWSCVGNIIGQIMNLEDDEGIFRLSSATKENRYQRENKDWKFIFERIFTDFQKMIQEA